MTYATVTRHNTTAHIDKNKRENTKAASSIEPSQGSCFG